MYSMVSLHGDILGKYVGSVSEVPSFMRTYEVAGGLGERATCILSFTSDIASVVSGGFSTESASEAVAIPVSKEDKRIVDGSLGSLRCVASTDGADCFFACDFFKGSASSLVVRRSIKTVTRAHTERVFRISANIRTSIPQSQRYGVRCRYSNMAVVSHSGRLRVGCEGKFFIGKCCKS